MTTENDMQELDWHKPAQRAVMTNAALGAWMSAALDDPNVCDAMRADIREWFSAGEPVSMLTQALATARAEREALEVRERETLAVLQTAHESEAALVAEREALRQQIWHLKELLGRSLLYVSKCADMDLADAVACMMVIEHELTERPK